MSHIVRDVIDSELHPNSMNREDGFCFSKSWKPFHPEGIQAGFYQGYDMQNSAILLSVVLIRVFH
jgi:hypothetical protein